MAQTLVDLARNHIRFIKTFLFIGRFWSSHRRFMAIIDAADPALVPANLLIMAIAFMTFPIALLSDYSLLRVAIGFNTAYPMVVGLANVRVINVAMRHLSRGDLNAAEAALCLTLSVSP